MCCFQNTWGQVGKQKLFKGRKDWNERCTQPCVVQGLSKYSELDAAGLTWLRKFIVKYSTKLNLYEDCAKTLSTALDFYITFISLDV